ncbi:unnamed protein product [Rhizophagus irregularis]|nr:unnamed protein product [Rhizophagus irregularis]
MLPLSKNQKSGHNTINGQYDVKEKYKNNHKLMLLIIITQKNIMKRIITMKLLMYPILFTIILALIIFQVGCDDGNDALVSDFFNETEDWGNDNDSGWNNLEDVEDKTKEFDFSIAR